MRKTGTTKVNTVYNQMKKQEVIAPATPPMNIKKDDIKMDIEEQKLTQQNDNKSINIEEVIDSKKINLDDTKKEKKQKKVYDLDDNIIRDITLANDIHVKLLSNMNGYFVDIRKYFRGYPSQKGIRMAATKFVIASEYLKKDIDALGLQYPNIPSLQSATP